MRLLKLVIPALVALILASAQSAVLADGPSSELLQLLPDRLGGFRRSQPVSTSNALSLEGYLIPAEPGAEAEYLGGKGERVLVELLRFHQDSEAYSLLSIMARGAREKQGSEDTSISQNYGTAAFATPDQIAFFKGVYFVRVSTVNPHPNSQGLATFTKLFAERLDKGEGEIPVLVKHLANWEQAQKSAIFLSHFATLEQVAPEQAVLRVIAAEGDADAVVGSYGASRLLIVEFNTPQLAADNDRSILAKIKELHNQVQPVSSGYRRVGNYSVFVFNAPSEQASKELIDQVKYEQVVQWLGENPNILKEAERRYVETTLGVFFAVIKASGVAALACLAVGGLFGALLFTRRRAQLKEGEVFSDAGGMVRLNIDELSAETNPSRLISGQH